MVNLIRLTTVACIVFLASNSYEKKVNITFIVLDSQGPAFW